MRVFVSIVFTALSPLLSAQSTEEKFQPINSAYDEQNPVLSPDGLTLFFTIGNHPANSGGKKDPGDIWFSRKEGQLWSGPVHGGPVLNDKGYNAVAGFSADGSQVFLHGHYGSNGNVAKTQGISVSKNSGAGWSKPENISIPYFMNKSGILSGSLSRDNSVFIFSAESYATQGVDDIYVSLKQQGKWSEPKNLGRTINTQFQELSPSLSDDNTTIFFSSNGLKGHGSFDVFVSTRLDDSWLSWSTPQNLGPKVNSEGRELFYRFYPEMGFALYTTTQSSDGYGDVRLFATGEIRPAHDTVVYASLKAQKTTDDSSPPQEMLKTQASVDTTAPDKTADAGNEVTIHGKISNAKTGETIAAKISFEGPDAPASPSVTSRDNGYSIALPSSEYTIKIEANGYISTLEKLAVNALDMRDVEMNFTLQPVELGTTVNLKNVLFAQAKTEILPESFPELDLVVKFLKENPAVKIELMGHTDARGVHADNVKLSQQRVNKVKRYLVDKGIDSRRISGKGFGGSKPIASNDTEESRRMNRRVEFVIRKF
jgi:OmpA-OmpF porin, OOP family